MKRNRLLLAGVLGLACLFGGITKSWALGTETVNGHLKKAIYGNKVNGASYLMWNFKDQGSTTAIYNEAGSSTIQGGTVDVSDIFDKKVLSISYASITNNGTPTFKFWALNGTTTTGTLLAVESCNFMSGLNPYPSVNPWIPTATTGTSATFLITQYCEKMAVSLEIASGGTTTDIVVGLSAINEIP